MCKVLLLPPYVATKRRSHQGALREEKEQEMNINWKEEMDQKEKELFEYAQTFSNKPPAEITSQEMREFMIFAISNLNSRLSMIVQYVSVRC